MRSRLDAAVRGAWLLVFEDMNCWVQEPPIRYRVRLQFLIRRAAGHALGVAPLAALIEFALGLPLAA